MSNLTKLNIVCLLFQLSYPVQHQLLCIPLMLMKLSRFSSRQSANRYWSLYFKSLWKVLLSYKTCCAATAMSLEIMVLSKKNSKMKFSAICGTLFDSHYMSLEDAYKAKEQYLQFLDTVMLPNWETFLAFNIEKD